MIIERIELTYTPMKWLSLFLQVLLILYAGKVMAEVEERTIISYGSQISVRPGDNIDFMVNTIGGGSYQADLVRIVNGDFISRYKEHFETKPVSAAFTGKYEGVEQQLNLGSYVQVSDTSALDNDVATITRNVLNRFLDPTPFPPVSDTEGPDVDRHPENPEYEHADQR